MQQSQSITLLRRVARMYGIQPCYVDARGQTQAASAEAMLHVLATLGAPVARLDDLPSALRQRREEIWQQVIEPVCVIQPRRPQHIAVRLPVQALGQPIGCVLVFEDGSQRSFQIAGQQLSVRKQTTVEGRRYVSATVCLPGELPYGYHQLHLELPGGQSTDGRQAQSLLIAAPPQAYSGCLDERLWGLFIPLYALHSRRSLGAGDFADLSGLIDWLAQLGGRLVATLPLLATFASQCEDPSPYKPASRMFWNEMYLDLSSLPELARCPAAQEMLASAEFQAEAAMLRQSPLVDYQRLLGVKRRVLEALAECFFAAPGCRGDDLQAFLRRRPEAEDYARFRAAGQRHGLDWRRWPTPLYDGTIPPGSYDQAAFRYHLYVQWQLDEQLRALAARADSKNMTWYLDLPLGAAPESYDVWRYRQCFADNAAGGAPPDVFFTKGQNWGFPPLLPAATRRTGHQYFINVLRRHLELARLLRIDHFMGVYRLYWIPQGHEATEGVYVRYPCTELCAILALESHRHRAAIVGENLGTVPAVVNAAMRRSGILGMYVLQYECQPEHHPPFRHPRADEVAALNTHDMPPFAAWWNGADIQWRLDLGLIRRWEAASQSDQRDRLRQALLRHFQSAGMLSANAADERQVLEAALAMLARSRAPVMLVNLEDLWLETQPQNTPGTFTERPNWRRKAKYAFEDFAALPSVYGTLKLLSRHRAENPRAVNYNSG
jgi:4-alpha-glucanotransferase